MYEELKIVDYGKDYGYGRYVVDTHFLEKSTGTNNFEDVIEIVKKFNEYCQEIKKDII